MERLNVDEMAFMIIGQRYNHAGDHAARTSVRDVYGLPGLMAQFGYDGAHGRISHKDVDKHIDFLDSGLRSGDCMIFVPVVRSDPAGYIICYKGRKLNADPNSKIAGFYIAEEMVAENMRRRGIYSATLPFVLMEARRMGKKAVFKEVSYCNSAALRASERNGFRKVKEAAVWKGLEFVMMARGVSLKG